MRSYTELKLEEVHFSYHAHWIALAEDGSAEAAKCLMSDAAILLQQGLRIPEPLGSYIGEALFKSAAIGSTDGDEIAKAFHLKRAKRSRNPYTQQMKNHLLCMEVRLAYLSAGHYEDERSGKKGAYEIVADMYDLKPESIKKTFTHNHSKWLVKEKSSEELHEILGPLRYWHKHGRTT